MVCLFSGKSNFFSFMKTSFFITAKLVLLAETLSKLEEPSRFLASPLHDRTSAHDLFILHCLFYISTFFLFSFSLLLDSVTVPINPLMNSQTRTRPDFLIIKICRKMQEKEKNTQYTLFVTSIFSVNRYSVARFDHLFYLPFCHQKTWLCRSENEQLDHTNYTPTSIPCDFF